MGNQILFYRTCLVLLLLSCHNQFLSIMAQSSNTYIVHMDMESMPKLFPTPIMIGIQIININKK